MGASDLDTLLDMGFERERAQLAVKQTGGLQGAIDWLEKNQEKSLEDIQAAVAEDDDEEAQALNVKPGEELARSLVCNDCGKQFRTHAQAEFHATKTEHMNFSESTDEIAPLTEEEKVAKLAELKEKAAQRKAAQSEEDNLATKRNEEIRRKATKEQQDLKEELQRKEHLKEAQAKKREKQDEIDAKKRIQAKIAADKEERRLKAEREKAARAGQPLPAEPVAAAPLTTQPATSKPASAYTETRLRLQTSSGTVQKSFSVDTTLFEVAHAIREENGVEASAFQQNFPRKVFENTEFGSTLKELGLVPSAALIVK